MQTIHVLISFIFSLLLSYACMLYKEIYKLNREMIIIKVLNACTMHVSIMPQMFQLFHNSFLKCPPNVPFIYHPILSFCFIYIYFPYNIQTQILAFLHSRHTIKWTHERLWFKSLSFSQNSTNQNMKSKRSMSSIIPTTMIGNRARWWSIFPLQTSGVRVRFWKGGGPRVAPNSGRW